MFQWCNVGLRLGLGLGLGLGFGVLGFPIVNQCGLARGHPSQCQGTVVEAAASPRRLLVRLCLVHHTLS